MKNTIKFVNWFSKWNSLNDILTVSCITLVFVIIVVYLLRTKRRSSSSSTYKPQTHNWHFNDLFVKPIYCNVCETVSVSGAYCSLCNIYTDVKCLKKAEKIFKCKQIFSNNKEGKQEFWPHHWIKGNLTLDSKCYICNELTGNLPMLSDYKCCWCLRNIHNKCLLKSNDKNLIVGECDFGDHAKLVLKPNWLIQNFSYFNYQLSLKDFKLDEYSVKNTSSNWTPLIIFANKNSGNHDAETIITQFSAILNPLQIIEMNKINPDVILNWMADYSEYLKFKILVCGGDGSIGWILETISKTKFKKYEPSVGILPLGTGNDLSRVLNWGDGYVGDTDLEELLSQLAQASEMKLDRWQVHIQKIDKRTNALVTNKPPTKLTYMNNYISVGCDALVTLNFHRERNKTFFANRIINKFIYFKYGTIDTFLKECRHLTENVEVELDGTKVELPHLESIVVLNIPYWGGGVQPWNIGTSEQSDIPKQSVNDGYLEVFGCYSSFHIAQLQVGLAEPYRIGQAKRVRIKLLKRFPVQCDGEPWEQSPGVIDISYFNQATMLNNN